MAASDQSRSVDQIESDLKATRTELEATVDELASRLDVKEQARRQAAHGRAAVSQQAKRLRSAATDHRGRPTTEVTAAVLAVTLTTVGTVLVMRRRR
ncbi:MAG: DUF3618 domain-containing protein [Terracoccus sp.]